MERVVRHAGTGRTAFYEHFANLELALTEVDARAEEKLVEPMRRALAAVTTPRQALMAVAKAWSDAIQSEPHLTHAVLRNRDGKQEWRWTQAWDRVLHAVLTEGHRAGTLGATGARRWVRRFRALLEASALAWFDGENIDAEELAEALLRQFR